MNFITIFPPGSTIHLTKDVGQIPRIFAKEFGFDSALITESIETPPKEDAQEFSFKIIKIKKFPLFSSAHLSSLYYLLRNASRINVINLYHLSLETKLLSILYKLINPRGFAYIKLDVNIQDEKHAIEQKIHRSWIRKYFGTRFHNLFFRSVDAFSAESAEGLEIVSKRYPMMRGKLIEVTNGIEVSSLDQDTRSIIENKEDLIITVGRVGSYEKNNELFLRALAITDLKHWKVAIIGPYTPEFKILFDSFIKMNPKLQKKIELVGNISNRDSLFSWYSRAKILAMTSRREGFPLVFPEAQCHGIYIISTNVSSIVEITNNLRYGNVVDDNEIAISNAINTAIENEIYKNDIGREIIMHARKKYDWKNTLRDLHAIINRKNRC